MDGLWEGRRIDDKVLMADGAPVHEVDELRGLVAEGQERGYLTFDEIATALEEVDVTKEQVQELHSYLTEQGIDVVGADGRHATSEVARVEAAAEARKASAAGVPMAPKKPELDLTVEPSLDSLRLYLRSIGRVPLRTSRSPSPSASSAATWPPSSTWSRRTCGSSCRSRRAISGAG
jgi:RNA polymerase primary sigma factor